MLSRRSIMFATLIATAAAGTPAIAAETRAYDPASFAAAEKAGKPILVAVHASWCSTCKAQKPILSNLAGKAKFKDVTLFEIDFDTQKDLLRTFRVQRQSTLIAFRGTQEVGRSTGDTNPTSIEALLDKSV